jgi:hypothetical protein
VGEAEVRLVRGGVLWQKRGMKNAFGQSRRGFVGSVLGGVLGASVLRGEEAKGGVL